MCKSFEEQVLRVEYLTQDDCRRETGLFYLLIGEGIGRHLCSWL